MNNTTRVQSGSTKLRFVCRTSKLCFGAFLGAVLAIGPVALAQEKKPTEPPKTPTTQPAKAGDKAADTKPDDKNAGKPDEKGYVAIELKLPPPAFKGTPTQIPPGTNLEPPRKGPRPPFMAPPGTKNVAKDKPVTSSDMEPVVGEHKLVTDGNAKATEGGYVELGPRTQWVQIDLKDKYKIYGVLVWHYHSNARVYHDVVVQVADDPDFIENVRTLFNNDRDNSSGLGLGDAKEYWETNEGKLITADGVVARYVRLYSNGSTADELNHYTEVEVYALPAK
jgi:hypothetical protein